MGRRFFLTVAALGALAALVGCASEVKARRAPEQLYFAIEVHQDGKRIAAPKLLGFEGRNLLAEKRMPGAPNPEYRLLLHPEEKGSGYDVVLQLELPNGRRAGKIGLLHGEERRVLLDSSTELKLMLMRVDSPEFRALMELRPGAGQGAI